jgi:hypothetical protein
MGNPQKRRFGSSPGLRCLRVIASRALAYIGDSRYTRTDVILPFRRDHMRALCERDTTDELAAAQAENPGERLALALELSDLVREFAEAADAPWLTATGDLAEKAGRFLEPLRMAAHVSE